MKVKELIEAVDDDVPYKPIKLPASTPWYGSKQDLSWYEANSDQGVFINYKSALGPSGKYKVHGFEKVTGPQYRRGFATVTIKREGEPQQIMVEFEGEYGKPVKFFIGSRPVTVRQAFNQFNYNAAKAKLGKKPVKEEKDEHAWVEKKVHALLNKGKRKELLQKGDKELVHLVQAGIPNFLYAPSQKLLPYIKSWRENASKAD